MRSATVASVLVLGALLSCRSTPRAEEFSRSFLGTAPPEIAVPASNWFNAAQAPRLEGLRGKVVWLEFSFST